MKTELWQANIFTSTIMSLRCQQQKKATCLVLPLPSQILDTQVNTLLYQMGRRKSIMTIENPVIQARIEAQLRSRAQQITYRNFNR